MPNNPAQRFVEKLLTNKHGKIVVWQFPNTPLISWLLLSVLAFFIKQGKFHTGFHDLAQASLFVWAYMELRMGDSLFRRILGGVVLLSIIIGFFY